MIWCGKKVNYVHQVTHCKDCQAPMQTLMIQNMPLGVTYCPKCKMIPVECVKFLFDSIVDRYVSYVRDVV